MGIPFIGSTPLFLWKFLLICYIKRYMSSNRFFVDILNFVKGSLKCMILLHYPIRNFLKTSSWSFLNSIFLNTTGLLLYCKQAVLNYFIISPYYPEQLIHFISSCNRGFFAPFSLSFYLPGESSIPSSTIVGKSNYGEVYMCWWPMRAIDLRSSSSCSSALICIQWLSTRERHIVLRL